MESNPSKSQLLWVFVSGNIKQINDYNPAHQYQITFHSCCEKQHYFKIHFLKSDQMTRNVGLMFINPFTGKQLTFSLSLNLKVIEIVVMQRNISFMTIKGVYTYIFSLKPPWQIRACELTDTFLHVPLKRLNLTFLAFYFAPSQRAPPATKLTRTKHPHWEKKEKWGEWHTERLGEKEK